MGNNEAEVIIINAKAHPLVLPVEIMRILLPITTKSQLLGPPNGVSPIESLLGSPFRQLRIRSNLLKNGFRLKKNFLESIDFG